MIRSNSNTDKTYSILMIEDDEADVKLIERMLRRSEMSEYKLLWAKNLNESVELLQNHTFDAILLDFYLGCETAQDVLEALSHKLTEFAVIVLSGKDTTLVDEFSFGMGVDCFLAKDQIDARILERTIRYAIRNSEQQSRIRNFSRRVAHDLKGPIGNVANALMLLESDPEGLKDSQIEFCQIAQKECDRIARIIDGLQSYSLSQTGVPKPKNVRLDQLVREAIDSMQADISAKNAEIHYPELPTASVDPKLMLHVFMNLLQNGLKYNRQTVPSISIKAMIQDRLCLISFTDNGIGIPEKHSSEIFKPMTRLHGNREFTGTGLGLAMCKEIVECHGGRIWVKSDGIEGRGSTFFVLLPYDASSPEHSPPFTVGSESQPPFVSPDD